MGCVPATAEDAPTDAQPPGWFKKLDHDSDGTLSAKEAGRFLAALDADKDDKVTVAEAIAYVKRRQADAARKGNRQPRQKMLLNATDFDGRDKTGDGLWVVSIGHSCVIPAIEPCIAISRSAGYENHTHLMQFHGGGGGAAKAQWSYEEDRQQAKPALATGKIDVMTFGHLVTWDGTSVGCDVEDYQRWIEFAMKHNPDIKFYIQDLWPWLADPKGEPNVEFSLEEFEAAMDVSSQSINAVIAQLNKKYPGRVHILPAGLAMTELVRRVSNNELPGVDTVLIGQKEKKEGQRAGLYRDKIHPTGVVATLQGYIYYACLYGENPMDLKTGIFKDEKLDRILREVAWETASQHPRSGVKSK